MYDTQTATATSGWSNRETWLASLWLSNDVSSYGMLLKAYKRADSDFERAEWLESQLRDQLDSETGGAGLWSDLLSTAFARINWLEVIENNQ